MAADHLEAGFNLQPIVETPWPFLHELLADRVEGTRGVCVIHGMRGAGKTVVLEELAQRGEAELVSGRNRAFALERLTEIARHAFSGHPRSNVLVDDLDHLLRDPGRNDRPDLRVNTLLWTLKEASFSGGWTFCLTTTASPSELEYTPKLSNVLRSGPILAIRPWHMDVDGTLRKALRERVGRIHEPVVIQFSGGVFRVSDTFIDAWCRAVQDLTGGHPALVGPAMALCQHLLARHSFPRTAAAEEAEATVDALLPAIAADLARTGMNFVRHRIRALRQSSSKAEKDAFAKLVKIGRGTDYTAAELSNATGIILEQECLAYFDHAVGKYRTLGTMITEEVVRIAKEEEDEPDPFGSAGELHLRPGDDPEEGGVAYADVASGEALEVRISGSPWRVLRVLEAHRGKILSLADIGGETGLSETASRTAVQRLVARLRAGGLSGAVENLYGQGYRLR